jgi:hypothetical protein
MKTTLKQIREKSPSAEVWSRLLAHLGKTKADDDPLSIATIVESNGISDALWCLRAVNGHDKEIRLYAVWCARQMQHLMRDPRSLAALDVAEAYANGMATFAELKAAEVAARAAARAAEAAARAAELGAVLAAPWAAAEGASWAAVRAAEAAARAAAWDAELGASWSATRAARAAAEAAARAEQKKELLRICAEIEQEKGQP